MLRKPQLPQRQTEIASGKNFSSPVAQFRVRATEAQIFAGNLLESAEIDSFSTATADHAISLVTWQFGWIDMDANAVYAK